MYCKTSGTGCAIGPVRSAEYRVSATTVVAALRVGAAVLAERLRKSGLRSPLSVEWIVIDGTTMWRPKFSANEDGEG